MMGLEDEMALFQETRLLLRGVRTVQYLHLV